MAPKANAPPKHLLPATNTDGKKVFIPVVPSEKISSFTLGRGTVLWRIWPAVLLHTVFAAAVVVISDNWIDLGVPNVLLTVCGVVIGFVLSYRASSGYDRYWMGRSHWADLIRNGRTLSRLIWFHVPARLAGGPKDAVPEADFHQVMREKRLILKLIEGYMVATKHHLRGELGIFYEDLYHLIPTLHEHKHAPPPIASGANTPKGRSSAINVHPAAHPAAPLSSSPGELSRQPSAGHLSINFEQDGYGATNGHPGLAHRSASTASTDSEHDTLLPKSLPEEERRKLPLIATELIPFSSVAEIFEPAAAQEREAGKHRPRVANGGQILPLQILWCISDWLATCESRGTVPGTSLGTMIAVLASFEDALSNLEKILTTPLPFVYSVHIRHVVWVYLICLPFQLVDQFRFWTIPGVAIATFFFIGLLAAGEEIEQPFGYDENDLDLDLFVNEIVHNELVALAKSPGTNAPPAAGETEEEEERHQGSVVEACLPKSRALGKGAKKKKASAPPSPAPAPAPALAPAADASASSKNKMDGVLVDVHVPLTQDPGANAGGDKPAEWGAPPH